jgi:transcriptional antiterminator RfaH
VNQNLVKNWLVVQIKPNSYDLAVRNLERQGFETFLPKMKATIKKENKFINKDVLVFPGYIFVGVDLQNSDWTKINSTYGVLKVLVLNNKPCKISNDVILVLKNNYEANITPIIKESLQKGDFIKFNSGPFVDLIASIENVDETNRISVLLDAMGGKRRLRLQQTGKLKYNKF